MVNGKYIKINRVLERVHSDYGFENIPIEDAIEWIGGLLAITSVPYVLRHDIADIAISQGRGKLPCNLESIIQVAKVESKDFLVRNIPAGTFYTPEELLENELQGTEAINALVSGFNSEQLIPMRWATNTFHKRYHLSRLDFDIESSYTYQVNDNYIFTNFQTGTVAMSYLAIPTDDEGMPLIPDNESWIEACVNNIAWKWAKKLWLRDEISFQKFQYIEDERDWYVRQAVNRSRYNSIDKEEGATNRRLSSKLGSPHDSLFRNFQLPDSIRNNWN